MLEGQTLDQLHHQRGGGQDGHLRAPLILHFLLQKGARPVLQRARRAPNWPTICARSIPTTPAPTRSSPTKAAASRSWDDIKGKKIFNGPPRGAALVNARQAIVANTGFKEGEDYQGMQVNWGQLASTLVDGSAAGFVVPLTFPSERVVIALSAGEVKIVSTPKDVFESEDYQKMLKAPGNIPIEVKGADMGYGPDQGVTLISEDGIFRGLGMAFADIVNKDMGYELAKAITAAYIENLDQLKAKAPYARNINLGVLEPENTGFCGAIARSNTIPAPSRPGKRRATPFPIAPRNRENRSVGALPRRLARLPPSKIGPAMKASD